MTETFTYMIDSTVNCQTQNEALLLTEELSKMTECEVLNEESTLTGDTQGIQATDIGSLLEQFLEYEQGSDVEACSYPDSSYITPCGSPRESDDVVLGRLMIVQEKLSQEVCDDTPPSTPIHNGSEIPPTGQKILKRKLGGLTRTVNGVHPKGDNIRMADSPKFAKFKKKRLTNEPPLRRCASGTTTPRATSPSDIVSPEEKKRREAKLIEALALTLPHNKKNGSKGNVGKAKKNLNNKKNIKQTAEPLSSRMMPVVSKRFRNNNNEKTNNNLSVNSSNDPRLNRANYGENSNTTHFADINDALEASKNNCAERINGIVDMTIDHEALAVVSTNVASNNANVASNNANVASNNANVGSNNANVASNNANVASNNANFADCSTNATQQDELNNENEPLDPNKENVTLVEPKVEFEETLETNELTSSSGNVNIVEIKEEPISEEPLEEPKPKKRTPKNYRKTSNFHDTASSQESTADSSSEDEDDRAYRIRAARRKSYIRSRSYMRSTSTSPRRYQSNSSRSRSRSRTRSRSRSRSKSPISRIELYGEEYDMSPRAIVDKNSEDIKEKLIELSNPVPYDIEHERKVQFLTGHTTKGNVERRNIYVGGIDQITSKMELAERFRRFGKIEKITLHFRKKGDNYAFIVFDRPEDATRAIEEGNDDPKYPTLELCFGGRRKFVGGSYVDFDGNTSYLEGNDLAPRNVRCESPESDFDQLLKMALNKTKKRAATPEWT